MKGNEISIFDWRMSEQIHPHYNDSRSRYCFLRAELEVVQLSIHIVDTVRHRVLADEYNTP